MIHPLVADVLCDSRTEWVTAFTYCRDGVVYEFDRGEVMDVVAHLRLVRAALLRALGQAT